MRTILFLTAFAALASPVPAAADTRSDIAALEQRWGEAVL